MSKVRNHCYSYFYQGGNWAVAGPCTKLFWKPMVDPGKERHFLHPTPSQCPLCNSAVLWKSRFKSHKSQEIKLCHTVRTWHIFIGHGLYISKWSSFFQRVTFRWPQTNQWCKFHCLVSVLFVLYHNHNQNNINFIILMFMTVLIRTTLLVWLFKNSFRKCHIIQINAF